MLFKVGDVLEYNNGYSAIILEIDDTHLIIETSDGYKQYLTISSIINGVVEGNINFKSLSGNIKPSLWVKSKFKL